MRDNEPALLDWGEWYLTGPFRLVYVSLGLALMSLLAAQLDHAGASFFAVLMLLAGLLSAGMAVWWRMASGQEDTFEERSKTAVLVALASGTALVGLALSDLRKWDSMKTFFLVAWVAILVSVMVLLLPRLGRRLVVSLAVVFHFGGILTAVTAVGTSNGSYPWLPTHIWNRVYRNYLTFTYLNNAYHFYSPEPGPPSLVWFQVEFEDGKTRWIRLVQREDFPTRQQYQRMLSVTESVNQTVNVPVTKINQLAIRRGAAGSLQFSRFKDSQGRVQQLPMAERLNLEMQYREPSDLAKKFLASYAAYVLRTTKHPENPDLKPRSVKIYRITHQLITAAQLENDIKPTDPTLFWVYFQGKYRMDEKNNEAVLMYEPYGDKDQDIEFWEEIADGTMRLRVEKAKDPFLYWLLPIYRVPKEGFGLSRNIDDYVLIDSLSIHAGEKIRWEDME